jgi:pimeloyl-ACP methyl ester carboxylesterase
MERLSAGHDVLAVSMPGHYGGPPLSWRATFGSMVDHLEREMDAAGWRTAHVVGNSLGGWAALELARRGRARSVCALSPAGMWRNDLRFAGRSKLRLTIRMTQLTHRALPLIAHSSAARRFALRDSAAHGERVSPEALIDSADAVLQCTVGEELLTTRELCQPLEVHCPIDVVWSELDRIFPVGPFTETARQRIPSARHLVLDGIGHVPMFDDPQRVARTILDTVARTRSHAHVTTL